MNISKNMEIFEQGNKYLMSTYSRLPVVFVKAKMQYLWDAEGSKYLDFIAGYGCLNVGHSNKFVVNALKQQIGKIIQPSNIYFNQSQVKLAQKASVFPAAQWRQELPMSFHGKIFQKKLFHI